MRESNVNIQPLPIEFRSRIEAGERFQFSKLFEALKVHTQDGRSAVLQGFEQIVVNFYAATEGMVVDQVMTIPESKTPIIQRKEGNILNFFYPYVFKDNETEKDYFEVITGTGIAHFMAIGIVEPSQLVLNPLQM